MGIHEDIADGHTALLARRRRAIRHIHGDMRFVVGEAVFRPRFKRQRLSVQRRPVSASAMVPVTSLPFTRPFCVETVR